MNACDPNIQRLVPALLILSMAAATMIAGLVIYGGICLVRRLCGPDEADTLTLWDVPPGTPPGAVFHLQPGVRLKWPPGSSYSALMLPKRCARCGDRRISQVEPGSHILTMACDACGERWLP